MQSRNQYIFLSIKSLRSSYYLYDSVILVAPCFKYTIAYELILSHKAKLKHIKFCNNWK